MWSHRGVSIDICAHIFQTIQKTATRTVAQICLPFIVLSWKSWYLKVFIQQEMERYWFVIAQYPWCLFKWAKVTLPKYQRVNLSLMPLLLVMAQLLTLHLGISRLHLLTLLSCRWLTLSPENLALKLTGWIFWLRVWISVFQDLKISSTPSTTRFKCISQPLRHN